MRQPHPSRGIAGPTGDDGEHPLAVGALNEDIEPFLRGRIDPVNVLEHEEQARLSGQALDQTLERGQRQFSPPLLRHLDRRIPISRRDGDEWRQQGNHRLHRLAALAKQRFELRQLPLHRVLALELREAFRCAVPVPG